MKVIEEHHDNQPCGRTWEKLIKCHWCLSKLKIVAADVTYQPIGMDSLYVECAICGKKLFLSEWSTPSWVMKWARDTYFETKTK
jgi:hypothetical protein